MVTHWIQSCYEPSVFLNWRISAVRLGYVRACVSTHSCIVAFCIINLRINSLPSISVWRHHSSVNFIGKILWREYVFVCFACSRDRGWRCVLISLNIGSKMLSWAEVILLKAKHRSIAIVPIVVKPQRLSLIRINSETVFTQLGQCPLSQMSQISLIIASNWHEIASWLDVHAASSNNVGLVKAMRTLNFWSPRFVISNDLNTLFIIIDNWLLARADRHSQTLLTRHCDRTQPLSLLWRCCRGRKLPNLIVFVVILRVPWLQPVSWVLKLILRIKCSSLNNYHLILVLKVNALSNRVNYCAEK